MNDKKIEQDDLDRKVEFLFDSDHSDAWKTRELLAEANIPHSCTSVCDTQYPVVFWGRRRYMGLDRVKEFIQDYNKYHNIRTNSENHQ